MNSTKPAPDPKSDSNEAGESGQPPRPRRGRPLLVAGAVGVLGAVFEAACLKGDPSYDEGKPDAAAKDASMVVVSGSPDAGASNGR